MTNLRRVGMPAFVGAALLPAVLALTGACGDGPAPAAGGRSGEQPPWPRDDSSLSEVELEGLRSLGYVAGASSRATGSPCGVSVFDKGRAFEGYNLFQDYQNEALLMDMEGRIVHVWSLPEGRMEAVRLMPDGSIIGVGTDLFFRLRWDSTPVFSVHHPFHHDARSLGEGTFLVLSKETRRYAGRNVDFDLVERRDAGGQLLDSWSTWEALDELRLRGRPSALETPATSSDPRRYDYFHLNTARPLPDTPLGRRDRRFRQGNWLLCARNTDLVFILDSETRKVVWSWGPGELEWPHAPEMLADGTIMIFDNGSRRNFTRLLRIDPVRGVIVWKYVGTPPDSFYCWQRGVAQPLPNGNVLVTDSEAARAFEITRGGEVVWDYYHANEVDGVPQSIYQMLRVPRSEVEALLATHVPSVPASSIERRNCGSRPTPQAVRGQIPAPEPQPEKRLDLRRAAIEVPPAAKGSEMSLLDGDERTALITKGVNPAVFVLVFPEPVEVATIGVLVGQPDDGSDKNDWWVDAADTVEELSSGRGSFRRVVAPRRRVGGAWDRAGLDPSQKARCWRVTVHRVKRDDYVHVYELALYRP
ncbi:MAG: arylsulfotransferase family protein [Thermoanaerobaculales bacterium]